MRPAWRRRSARRSPKSTAKTVAGTCDRLGYLIQLILSCITDNQESNTATWPPRSQRPGDGCQRARSARGCHRALLQVPFGQRQSERGPRFARGRRRNRLGPSASVISDRSLGPGLPGRQWKRGGELRAQLVRLGIYRPSGHEHFVGCLVVPVVNAGGEVVAMCGRRLDRGRGELWAEGLPGGWFNAPACLPAEVLLARDIFDALAVIAAGHGDVVALGHPGRLSAKTPRSSLAGEPARSPCSARALKRPPNGSGARASRSTGPGRGSTSPSS